MDTNTGEVIVNGIAIHKKRADNVLRWLIRQEAENVRTKSRSDVQMISDIQKKIQEEVERR